MYSHSVVEEAVAISWALCTKISQDARMCLSWVREQELDGASFTSEHTASDQSKATIFKVTHCLSCLFRGILRMEAHGGVSRQGFWSFSEVYTLDKRKGKRRDDDQMSEVRVNFNLACQRISPSSRAP